MSPTSDTCHGECTTTRTWAFAWAKAQQCDFIHEAARSGDLEKIKLLLNEARSSVLDKDGPDASTPLHWAAFYGHLEIAKLLLEAGKTISNVPPHAYENNNGETPLHWSAFGGRKDVSEFLLKHGWDANAVSRRGDTPLHCAVEWGGNECVELLLINGADVNAWNDYQISPLQRAEEGHYRGRVDLARVENVVELLRLYDVTALARDGNFEKISVLLKVNPRLALSAPRFGKTPLHEATANGHMEVAELLVASGADVNEGLRSAIENGRIEFAEFFLAKNAKVDDAPSRNPLVLAPLHLAATLGKKELVTLLIAHQANVDKHDHHGCSPLYYAVAEGHTEIVQCLLSHNASVKEARGGGWTALQIAAAHGYTEVVALLLASKADVNERGHNAWTPLQSAVEWGQKEAVELLLANKADVNARTERDFTSLHMAASPGYSPAGWPKGSYLEIAKLLVANGADVNATDRFGHSPLHLVLDYARQNLNRTNMVQLLLANKADPNAATASRRTPLEEAVNVGDLEMVKLLLAHGANLDAPSNQTLVELAAYHGHKEVAEALQMVRQRSKSESKKSARGVGTRLSTLADGWIEPLRLPWVRHALNVALERLRGRPDK